MSIIPQELRSFDYYLRKLPLFLRQSDTFIEHFRIWFDLLNGGSTAYSGIVDSADCLLYLLNIFDDDYIDTVNSLVGNENGTVSDILDKLGALFGVHRVFSVTYKDDNDVIHEDEQLELNNQDFLTLIKAQIIKDYCDGTAEQIEQFYDSIGLKIYVITTDSNATASLYLAEFTGVNSYSDNIKKMFQAGILRINNLGIAYKDLTKELTGSLIWDAPAAAKQGWGKGLWAE